jgi:predicted ATP-grasp superfamily ATP-dependent carboligase
MPAQSLLIIGASVRAAAFSALRAGFAPTCADLFADEDLRLRCPCLKLPVRDYSNGLLRLAKQAPPGPWMYTGALENHRELVRQLSRQRVLWGNDAAVLRRVRSPLIVTRYLERAGIPCPRVRQPQRVPRGLWVAKPLASAGGHGIYFWPSDPRIQRSNERRYLQEFIHGPSCAAIFLGDGKTARLLGVTRQLERVYWLHAKTWQYAGSIGPLELTPLQQAAFDRLGNALVAGFALRGLFGVDCILNLYDHDMPYPVEINPRYTASVEVLEYATGIPFLALHRRVFDPDATSDKRKPDAPSEGGILGKVGKVGKAILFAKERLVFPKDGPWMPTLRQPADVNDLPAFADIPGAGQRIAMGRPILTLFARAATAEKCAERLREIAADLDRHLFGT